MNRTALLALALALLAACAAEGDSGGAGGAGSNDRPLASWSITTDGVTCPNADQVQEDVFEQGQITCTWWCARWEGEPPVTPDITYSSEVVTVSATFEQVGGTWTPVRFYTWIPQCASLR
jgi:hypothetical protein